MPLTGEQQAIVEGVIDQALDEAEAEWEEHGPLLAEAATKAFDKAMVKSDEAAPSKIPGSPVVTTTGSKVDNFVALVADMRNSTEHLTTVLSGPKVQKLQRVYYETAALLPALEVTIGFQSGSVTEYLGDGVLALFKAESATDMKTVQKARRAAENCIGDTLEILNDELDARYHLPPLMVGVGLAIGPAIVQLVGLPNRKHPKAFGACIWKATKLCGGVNAVIVDPTIYKMWPSSDGGPITFTKREVRGEIGYALKRKKQPAESNAK